MKSYHRHDKLSFYSKDLMFYYPNIIRFSLALIFFFMVASVLSDSLIADTDEDHIAQLKGWTVAVSPASFSYDEEFTIAMSGLPGNFPFDTTSVSLGGARVSVLTQGEGHYGQPMSDDDGKLEIKAVIVDWSSSGSQYLKVDIPNIFVAKTPVDFKPVKLRVSSTEIVPYQEVWVVGMGFTKPSRDRGWRSISINGNTSTTASPASVTIGGEPVFAPYIGYPERLGRDGSVFFKMIVPESKSTITPGQVKLRVIDSEGREGTAMLTVPAAKLGLSNHISYPGENVPFEITGLQAHRVGFDNDVKLKYGYAIDSSGKKYTSVAIGSFTANDAGGLSGRFDIPKQALLASSNKIWVTDTGSRTWEFIHHLADRSISLLPASGFQGDPIMITIKGMPANYLLSSGSVFLGSHKLKVPGYFEETGAKPVSNNYGSLTFPSVVPTEVSPGYHSLTWKAPGGKTATSTSKFLVVQSRLYFDPPWVVPGQMVTMDSEYHSVKVLGGSISGSGDSYVFFDDAKMMHDTLDYPISISADGKFETTFAVPIDNVMLAKDRVKVTTADTAGRTALGTLYLKHESVTVTPAESARGTNIVVEGSGFFANSKNANSSYRVFISYGGVQMGSAVLDDIGAFKTSLIVPSHAVVGAKNEITVALAGWPSVKEVSAHRVPASAVQVTPDVAYAGEQIMVTGTGYAQFKQLTVGIGHLWATDIGPKVYTDEIGNFEIFVKVPQSLNKGLVPLHVYAPYPNPVASVPFQVR